MECAIKFLDNPKDYYEPSDKLKAEITLSVPKTEKISRINYEVLGYVKCSWYESKPVGNTHRVDHYEGQENYMNQSFCLVGEFEDDQVEITAGEHKFDISYALPSNLPTSFKSKNGSIKYKILVIVDRSKKANSKFEFPFTVIRPLNLNDAGSFLRNPLKVELFKNFKMDFSAEPLYLSASIPFYGYVPGQVIHVDVEVNNQSKTHVKEVTASLKKLITMNSDGLVKKSKLIIESEAKVSADRVPVSSRRNFEIKLEVPSLAPEILNCGVIQVHYELQIKAKTSGLSRSPRLNLPITIGTVPLQNRNAIPPSPTYSSLLPPSYEQAVRDGARADSSDGENNFNPRYPVFKFEEGDHSSAA